MAGEEGIHCFVSLMWNLDIERLTSFKSYEKWCPVKFSWFDNLITGCVTCAC